MQNLSDATEEAVPSIGGRTPNFFIVGAPKCGTTSLHSYLAQHPDIFMSPMKETCYFSTEFRVEHLTQELQELGEKNERELRAYLDAPGPLPPRFGGMISSREDYCRLFAEATQERIVGEASPAYLWSRTAPTGIAAFAPDAKVLMILRNPLDRAYSQYLQMTNTGGYSLSLWEHLEACIARPPGDEIGMLHPFLDAGLYADALQRYRDALPESQIAVWLYEDTRAKDFHRKVFEFLGVDSEFLPDTSQRHLEQRIPRFLFLRGIIQGAKRSGIAASPLLRAAGRKVLYRSRNKMKMQVKERALLRGYYCDDVHRLEQMLGRDLSHWLS